MQVADTIVHAAVEAPGDPGWFAARQPGIIRYIEALYGAGSDVHGVGLEAALAIHAAYERSLGVPPGRVQSSLLARAERAVAREAESGSGLAGGVVARQPALSEFVAGVISNPPIPLTDEETARLGLSLLAVTYALDEVATGRPVP